MAVPKLYKDFYEQKVFTFNDVIEKYKKSNTVGSLRLLLYNCKVNGYIFSAKNGLYYIIPQGFSKDNYIVDKYLIANKLTSAGILGYHSALELLGVAQSVSNNVFVLTKERLSNFKFQEINYIGVAGNAKFGYITVIRDGIPICVTDRERTLIDGIDKLKYVGGLEEYLKSIETFPSVDFKKIEEYLRKYNKINLYSKVGFILSFFEKKWSFTDGIHKNLKSKITRKTYYLTGAGKPGKFNKEWNLIVPENLQELIHST